MWIAILYNELLKVCAESYANSNPKNLDEIVFPYLTYSIHNTPGDVGESGAYIDIEVFDNKSSDTYDLEVLVENISKHFERGLFIEEKYMIQSEFMSSKAIPTGSTIVSRRLIQLKFKISRRQ